MAIGWNEISPLPQPLKLGIDDVVMSGHGSYEFDGETTVPAGFELWVLGPPGATISDALGGAMESGTNITKLALAGGRTPDLAPCIPTRYGPGTQALDYVLHTPTGLSLKPKSGGPHMIGVAGHQKLSTLWTRCTPFAKQGKIVRVFWAACSHIRNAEKYCVIHQ